MTFERRDWWWALGMSIVCSGPDKRGWSEPSLAVLGASVGACLRLLISRLTKRARAR